MLSALYDNVASLASVHRRETVTWLLVVAIALYATLVAAQLLLGLLTVLLVLGCSALLAVADPPGGLWAALGRPKSALLVGVSTIVMGYSLVITLEPLGGTFLVALLWFFVLLFVPGGLVAKMVETVRTIGRMDDRLERLEERVEEQESDGGSGPGTGVGPGTGPDADD
jgi:hypothetical protein